jgi:hypothetical protein
MQSTKHSWWNLLPFGKMSSMISLRPVKKNVIMDCFVPMACRVLGMTIIGDRANILRTDRMAEPGFVTCYDSFKMILFRLVQNAWRLY